MKPLKRDVGDVLVCSPLRFLFSVASPSLGSTLLNGPVGASSAAASGGACPSRLISQVLRGLDPFYISLILFPPNSEMSILQWLLQRRAAVPRTDTSGLLAVTHIFLVFVLSSYIYTF